MRYTKYSINTRLKRFNKTDLKRKDIETIIKLIKPVTSKEFKTTDYEKLNIDKEGGLTILPEKLKVVKTLTFPERKKVYTLY